MGTKLWFITDGIGLIDSFRDKKSAEDKIKLYQDDPDYEYYSIYSVDDNNFADYPEEYDFALKKGSLS